MLNRDIPSSTCKETTNKNNVLLKTVLYTLFDVHFNLISDSKYGHNIYPFCILWIISVIMKMSMALNRSTKRIKKSFFPPNISKEILWLMWTSLEITGATAQICSRKAIHCVRGATKNQLPGATVCCQIAPVAIRHKDIINYRNSYICCELSFGSYFTCFHNKYQSNRSLCVHTLLCFGNIELYCENCPCFMWNCPWFMPNHCEPGSILKCKLPLVPAGLFQGLLSDLHASTAHFPFYIPLCRGKKRLFCLMVHCITLDICLVRV